MTEEDCKLGGFFLKKKTFPLQDPSEFVDAFNVNNEKSTMYFLNCDFKGVTALLPAKEKSFVGCTFAEGSLTIFNPPTYKTMEDFPKNNFLECDFKDGARLNFGWGDGRFHSCNVEKGVYFSETLNDVWCYTTKPGEDMTRYPRCQVLNVVDGDWEYEHITYPVMDKINFFTLRKEYLNRQSPLGFLKDMDRHQGLTTGNNIWGVHDGLRKEFNEKMAKKSEKV